MDAPQELSLAEMRKYMLENGCKVTNHALVKYFKRFLTHPETQNEARQKFKVYANILATIKNENNQKFLILRKKYVNECPSEEIAQRSLSNLATNEEPSSPGNVSVTSDNSLASPFRMPPPYKPPPEVNAIKSPIPSVTTGVTVHQENVENYRDCVNELAAAVRRTESATRQSSVECETEMSAADIGNDTLVENRIKSISRENSLEDCNKENIPRFSFSSGTSTTSGDSNSGAEKPANSDGDITDNPISVKEATRKFNRMASEEEAKVMSPPSKKKPEKVMEDKEMPEVTLSHPKAKEWIVSMAKANYQELAKLSHEYPELVKLQDPSTGYTALHWAAKHDNIDVIKLIAGTHKADVNARSNGGYTPLHLAMQFGRSDVFEILCNQYKANRDLMDWSGNKPLDYSQQSTSVSASTYSKIQAMRQQLLNSGYYDTWRNQSKEKTYCRKRFGLPKDWLFECASEEDNRSVQQLLGSGGEWQWEYVNVNRERFANGNKSPSPAVSPTPSLYSSSSSSSSRWYDTESPVESDGDDNTIRDDQSIGLSSECSH